MSGDNSQTFFVDYTVVISPFGTNSQGIPYSYLIVHSALVLNNLPLSLTYGADKLRWRGGLCHTAPLTHPVSTLGAECPTVEHPA